MLQTCEPFMTSQSVPLFLAGSRTLRVRFEMPVPHDLEHAAQADHSERMQLTGQPCVLQLCVLFMMSQASPPLDAGVKIDRDRFCLPPPQD